MRVFITGATGYIGSAVTQRLVETGHAVIGLARTDKAADWLRANGATPHAGDLNDLDSLREGVQKADATIHLAQERYTPGMSMQDMGRMLQQGGVVVAALVEASANTGKTLIHTGGTGAYGNANGALVDEDTPINPGPSMTAFAQAEQSVLAGAERGFRGISLRPAIVYGVTDGGLGPAAMWVLSAQQQGHAVYVGDGSNVVSTVHVRDVAEVYRLALENSNVSTLLNITNGMYHSMRDIAETITVALGLPAPVSLTPEQAFEQVGFGARLMLYDTRVSNARVQSVLGWQPQQPDLLTVIRSGQIVPQVPQR